MKTLLTAFISCCCLTLHAQADLWRSEDGLSNDWISDIVQDREGYIWLATQYGLNRFDGYDFESYNAEPRDPHSLSANWIRHLERSSDGEIYASCFYGLIHRYCHKDKSFVALTCPDSTVYPSPIRSMFFDGDLLWVGGDDGLFQLDEDRLTLRRVYELSIGQVLRSPEHSLLILTSDGIYSLDGGALNRLSPLAYPSDVERLFFDRQNQLWALNDEGLWKVDRSTWTMDKFPLKDYSPSGVFNSPSILEDRKGQLWVAGENGINIISSNRESRDYLAWTELLNQELRPLVVTKFMQDRDDNIWVGTNKGLIMISEFHRRFQVPEELVLLRDITGARAIHANDSMTWLGTEDGLYEINSSSDGEKVEKIFDQVVRAIQLSQDGSLYISSSRQLYVRPNGKDKFEQLNRRNHTSDMTWDIIEDRQGYIWFAGLKGLSRYNPKAKSILKFTADNHEDLDSNVAIHLTLDRQGNLWGGTFKNGVYKLTNTYDFTSLETAKFENYNQNTNSQNSISSNLIQCMTSSIDGSLWVGTDGGLNRINENGTVKQYLKKDGLLDDKFLSLHVDDNNILWGSTIGHGVMAMDIDTEEFQYFNKQDGLESNNYLLNSGFLTDEGMLILGSDSKTQIIDTDEVLKIKRSSSNFSFTDVSYLLGGDDVDISLADNVKIPFSQNSFNISFSTLQFFKAHKTQYEYRIMPHQEEWQDNGPVRTINFNGLSSGKYILEVRASNPRLEISPQIISLPISILPPWWRTWWAYLCYALLGIGIVYLFIRRQQELSEAKRLKELNELKAKLYTNVSHEIRTPLTVILGLSNKLMKDSKKSVVSTSEIINRNGNHLLLLVNRILDLSKIESGKMTISMTRQDLVQYLSYLLESFHSWAEEEDIRLHFLPRVKELVVDFDQELVKQIMYNLLSNAIKYTPPGGDVYCVVEEHTQNFSIQIKDNGVGISEENLSDLFDRFFQEEAAQNSSGIGLAVTKELVELLNGSISVSNNPKKGCTFTIELPKSKTAPEAEELNLSSSDSLVRVNLDSDLDKVLVIEDNQDVQNYIKSILRENFEVMTAPDGLVGVELARNSIPDLIISDIMMPGLTGYQVCHQLKTDLRTNHIPIILLTAKADHSSKLVGLEHGADDYLIKPFDAQELQLRISNLLAIRKSLSDKYAHALDSISARETTHLDPFIKELVELIEANLSDSTYSIARLCRELGISRVHLHRKLKALTDQSTAIFIRNIRLSKAKQMLLHSNKNVSEIAYDVGFSDPSYFSRVYSDRYGLSPSQEMVNVR